MRILSNLVVTGSLSSTNYIGLAPVSFSIISGTISQGGPSSGLWVDEDLNLQKWTLENSGSTPVTASDCNPLGGFGQHYIASASCESIFSFYNCVKSGSVAFGNAFNLNSGSYPITTTSGSGLTPISGSLRKYTISGSDGTGSAGESAGPCVIGNVTSFISGSYVVPNWSSFMVNAYDRGIINIIDSVLATSGSCNEKIFFSSKLANDIVQERMTKWSAIICLCFPRNSYIDIKFDLQYICKDALGNSRIHTRTYKFRVYKTVSGKCKICNDQSIIKIPYGIDDDVSPTGLLYKADTENEVSIYSAKYLQIPSFDSSPDSFYDFSNKTGSLASTPGLLYFNESDDSVYVYNGSTWTSIGGAGELSRYTTAIGDGSNSVFTVNHGKNTLNVIVAVRETSSPYELVYPVVKAASVNTVTVDFGVTIPTSNQYTVTVV